MSLQFFDNTQSESSSLPFLDEYLEKNSKAIGKHFLVESIVLAKTGKGYLIKTESFACFIWKKSRIANMLVEALQFYVDNEGFCIFVIPCKGNPNFQLAADTEQPCTWFNVGNGFTTTEPEFTLNDSNTNPFLPKTPAVLSPPTLQLVGDASVDVSPEEPASRKRGGGRTAG